MKKFTPSIAYIILVSSLLGFGDQVSAEIQPADIIAVWTFDEGVGNIAKDTEGKGIEAEIVGNPEWVNGIRGKALAFDGTVREGKDDVVKIPNSPHINTGGPFTNRTMMALFKPLDVSLPKQVIYEWHGLKHFVVKKGH